jgi:hypothetical protein
MDGACSTQRRESQIVCSTPAVTPRALPVGTEVNEMIGADFGSDTSALHGGAAVVVVQGHVQLSSWYFLAPCCLNNDRLGVLYSAIELWVCSFCGQKFAVIQYWVRQTVTGVGGTQQVVS